MKILFPAAVLFVVVTLATNAAQNSARVTQVIKDVQLVGGNAAPRPAAINDAVQQGTAVRTGTDSRTELTFADLTITRLGANTIFSFNQATRELDLESGAVLVEVPRGKEAAHVRTAAITAAITGGTALLESNKLMPAKLLVLEGNGHLCSIAHPDECVTCGSGEMTMMTLDGRILPPTKFNAALVMKTSKLIKGFAPLPNADLITAVIEQQQTELGVETSNNQPPPKDPADLDDRSNATTAGAGSSGGKFGPPTAILTPNPYSITSGTAINTDPTITTNGVTDMGKIYRGSAQDGPLPEWLGTTTSSFDSVQNITDNSPGGGFISPDSNNLPLAGFLFAGLDLNGDPTISNPSGAKIIGFASNGGISVPTPTTFTFSNTPADVGLIALNGSIDLSQASFQNFGELFVYARGSGSSVTVGSAATQITNLNRVQLRAEGDIQVNGPVTVNGNAQDHRGFKALAGNNIGISAPVTSSSGEILVQALGGVTLTSSSQLHSLLDSTNGTGPIIVYASGSDTQVNVSGTVQSDQGEIDIRQTGVAGSTNLSNATLHGDVVKVSALGTNGTLNINSGNMLTADTIIKLYAGGSNGTINFQNSVTINSPTTILAANTINIAQGQIVTVNMPGQTPATVYTNNANYFGFGGTGSPASSGTFSGAGASNPQPFNSNTPPLGAPGQGP